jgi:ribosomal-protein-alanine N-acetyltransferase
MSSCDIETDRLVLEWFAPELARAILAGEHRPDWAPDFPGDGDTRAARYFAIAETNHLENAPFLSYVIRERSSGLICGGTSFHGLPRERTIEIGYGLAESKRGFGYATEACGAMVLTAFASRDVDRVEAETDADNWRSKAVLKRAGFCALNDLETRWSRERDLGR